MSGLVLGFAAALLLGVVGPARAAEGGHLMSANVHLDDPASLQRGAGLFMNYCSGCHSLQYLRYSRMAEDLGLSEAEVEKNLLFTGEKVGEHVKVAMSPTDATNWFGKAPPDLSLEARARGADWIFTYLNSFYVDEDRPMGWNNTLLPGASMPHVLWQLQGSQIPVTEPKKKDGQGKEMLCESGEFQGQCITGFKIPESHAGEMSPAEYRKATRDISAFLQYAGEPAALKRQSMGVWVVLFLAVLTFLTWLLKHEYWRDVH